MSQNDLIIYMQAQTEEIKNYALSLGKTTNEEINEVAMIWVMNNAKTFRDQWILSHK